MHNIQIEIMCKWALHTVNQFFYRIYIKLFIQRPVLEPDVLTQIASNQKKHSNLQQSPKKKKKEKIPDVTNCIKLKRLDLNDFLFYQISSPSTKSLSFVGVEVGFSEKSGL